MDLVTAGVLISFEKRQERPLDLGLMSMVSWKGFGFSG